MSLDNTILSLEIRRAALDNKLDEYLRKDPLSSDRQAVVEAVKDFLDDEDAEDIVLRTQDPNLDLPDVFKELNEIKEIEEVAFERFNKLPDLSSLEKLKRFRMVKCDHVNDFDFSIFPNLRMLTILYCLRLTSCDLSKTRQLKTVTILGCRNIRSVSGGVDVRQLYVQDCPKFSRGEPPLEMEREKPLQLPTPISSYTVATLAYDVLDIAENKVRTPGADDNLMVAAGCPVSTQLTFYNERVEVATYLLDGATLEINLKEDQKANPYLQSNLFIGKSIIEHVQKKIIFSTNHMQRYASFLKKQEDNQLPAINQELVLKVCGMKQAALKRRAEELLLDPSRRKKPVCSEGFTPSEGNVGECGEMAKLGKEFGARQFPLQSIELVVIENGDHAFLVIGRPKNTNLYDYKSWPSDTVICDPWSGSCYPSSELERYLFDFISSDNYGRTSLGYAIPRVAVFDPIHQGIVEVPSL
ncbi:MAG: hypothetical protein FJZ63_04935 [Chlamydiae bacterium]|nr:hypothetical protein [Chlamydiota bacterium]